MSSHNAILPVPAHYVAGSTSKWLFTVWAGFLALVVLPYVVKRMIKDHDRVPLWIWIGGFICSLGEPMLDTLGHLWWPQNLPGPAFKAYHLDVPALIPPCYTATICVAAYIFYRLFLNGAGRRQTYLFWVIGLLIDGALELPGTAAKVYTYYGNQPFSVAHFPLHWAFMNATGYLTVGFAIWICVPHLRGKREPLIALIPPMAFLGAYGMVSWPAFLSVNADMPRFAQAIVDLGTPLLCLVLVSAMADTAERRQRAAIELGEPQPAAAQPMTGVGRAAAVV
jgi:hypothetical protein